MKVEIGKFYTFGKVAKLFLNSLGSVTGTKLNVLEKEKDIDLEKFQIIVLKELKKFKNEDTQSNFITYKKDRLYLDKKSFEIIEQSFKMYLSDYKKIVTETFLRFPQNELDNIIGLNFFESVARNILVKFNSNLCEDRFIKGDYANNNFSEQIFKSILNLIGKENFGFLNIEASCRKLGDEGLNNKKRRAYRFIKDFNSQNVEDKTIYEFVNLLGNEQQNDDVQLSEKDQINLMGSLFISRFYYNFLRNLNINVELVNKQENQNTFGSYLNNTIKELSKKNNLDIKVINELNNQDIFMDLVEKYSKDESKEKEVKDSYENFISNSIGLEYLFHYRYVDYLVSIHKEKEALEKCELALDSCIYKSENLIRLSIIQTGLVLSSALNKKSYFNKFYKYAYIFNLEKEPLKEGSVWKMAHYKKSYYKFFNMPVPENKEENSVLTTYDFGSSGKMIIPKLNLRSPNVKYFYNGRKRTQLMIYAMTPKLFFEDYSIVLKSIDKLIKQGADVNWKNDTGQTALMEALSTGNYEIALRLLECPEIIQTINQKSFKKKITNLSLVLEKIITAKDKDYDRLKQILIKLIEKKIDMNQKITKFNQTPIHYLIGSFVIKSATVDKENQKLEILELLLKNNADINIPCLKGFTPLILSAEVGNMNVVKKLMNYKPDYNKKTDQGFNIFEISAIRKNFNVLNYLLKTFNQNDRDHIIKNMLNQAPESLKEDVLKQIDKF